MTLVGWLAVGALTWLALGAATALAVSRRLRAMQPPEPVQEEVHLERVA